MELDRCKILIVDDEKAIRLGLSKCVEASGFTPLEAANGYEALQLVEQQRPGLVILDVMMRGMSGLEVCRLLRANSRIEGIKIIILSAKGQQKEKKEGIEAGADRYITKPFEYKELLRQIKQLVEKK